SRGTALAARTRGTGRLGGHSQSTTTRRTTMQITRNSIETMAGPSDWFTGSVYVDSIAAPSSPSRLSASSVYFTPGARTANRFMTHLAMQQVDEQGNAASWGPACHRRGVRAAPKVEDA